MGLGVVVARVDVVVSPKPLRQANLGSTFFLSKEVFSSNFKKRDLAISEGEVGEPHTVGSLKNENNRQHLSVPWICGYVYFLSLCFFLQRELPLKAKQIQITVVPPAAQH